jgi:glutathione synthase
MGLRVAVQMDPLASINIDGDSTFALMLEAQRRGHALFHYHVRDLSMRGKDNIVAKAHPVALRREKGNHYSFAARETIDLAACDVVLMRQDPPFDMAYITATHVLEHIHPRTLVVNDPAQVRNAPEKLFVTHFPDAAEIASFRAEFKDIIVKPLYGNGGAGVFRIKPDDENLSSLIEMFTSASREPLMVQRYEPAVRQGDKRIILVDGKAEGAINRVPAAGEARANMHVGGKAAKTELTKREREICETIGPELKKRGLIFVGIDVIGDWLTEINVTSPTGIQEIGRFDGTDLAAKIWDAIEAKR